MLQKVLSCLPGREKEELSRHREECEECEDSRPGLAWWYMFIIPAMREPEIGGSLSKAGPGQKQDPI
jgi:hypothetical protein